MHGLLANNGPLFNLSTSESSLVVPSSKTCQTFQKQKKNGQNAKGQQRVNLLVLPSLRPS